MIGPDLSAYGDHQRDFFLPAPRVIVPRKPSRETEQIRYWQSIGLSPREAIEALGEAAPKGCTWGECYLALCRASHSLNAPASRGRRVARTVKRKPPPQGTGRVRVAEPARGRFFAGTHA